MNGIPRPLRRDRDASPRAPAHLRVRIPAAIHAELLNQSRASLPQEGCGLLLGQRDDTTATVSVAIPADNTRASSQAYEIAPEAVLAADRRARADGLLLLGAWHSHPDGQAVPSPTDRAEAWPDWCYLIVGLADPGEPELRAWRLVGEDFIADTLEIT